MLNQTEIMSTKSTQFVVVQKQLMTRVGYSNRFIIRILNQQAVPHTLLNAPYKFFISIFIRSLLPHSSKTPGFARINLVTRSIKHNISNKLSMDHQKIFIYCLPRLHFYGCVSTSCLVPLE